MIEILDVIVIGAGISGVTAARQLSQSGKSVAVIEKARGSGGRLASKRLKIKDGPDLGFDLGCATFRANSQDFLAELEKWREHELVLALSDEQGGTRWTGQPRSSALTRGLLGELPVFFQTRVQSLERRQDYWLLHAEHATQGTQTFAARSVVISAPVEQTKVLLPVNHALVEALDNAVIEPQWVVALLIDSDTVEPGTWHERLSHGDVIETLSFESRKRHKGRVPEREVLTLQCSASWTVSRTQWPPSQILAAVEDELERCLGFRPEVIESYVHRWLYSYTSASANSPKGYLLSDDGIGICGDYMLANGRETGVESAWMSGRRLADALHKAEWVLREETA